MKLTYKKLQKKFNSRHVRERGLMLITLLTILAVSWDMLIYSPLNAEQEKVKTALNETKINASNAQVNLIKAKAEFQSLDPEHHKAYVAALAKEHQELDETLRAQTKRLITRAQMLSVLRGLIKSDRKIHLVHLENLSPEVAFAVANKELANKTSAPDAAKTVPVVFKHGLALEFTGEYFDIVEYLTQIENLDWEFYWDSFEIDMEEFPIARAKIRIFTLSMDEGWLGA